MTSIVSVPKLGSSFKALAALSATALLTALASVPAQASTQINKTFEFGPGTAQDHSQMRTFLIPANSTVAVAVDVTNHVGAPLVIEVHRADATSIDSTGPDGPLVDSMVTSQSGVNAFQNVSFTSPFGCPSTWRVRVRTANNLAPSVKISGLIVVLFTPPPVSNVTMPGGTQNIAKSSIATRNLAGIVGKGSGTIRLRAKWHTDPTDVLHFNQYFPLTVRLIRPNGTVAAAQTGFSWHAPAASTPKLDFSYNLTATDLALVGNWKVQITNNSAVNVVDFNIEKGLDLNPLVPSFHSTFTPRCN